MLMNAHSTAVMTILGRVVGNTMTNVRAANLKLIGRATYLAKTHIDDIIRRAKIQGCSSIEYSEANALLFDTMEWLDQNDRSQESPVPLTIVRAIQGLQNGKDTGLEGAEEVFKANGTLESYIYSTIAAAN
jgi:hypothetical protein